MDIVKNPIDYFKHPAISNSKLGWYKQSPAHYKYFQEHGTEDKPAYLIGSATHTVLFEPEKFDKTYHVLDESKRPVLLLPNGNRADFRNAENSKWRKDILDAYPHKIIITTEEYDMIMSMMQQLQKNSQAVELLQECEFEKEVYWIDPTTGLACKKKMDISGSAHRADYKTTDCADPYKWQRKAWGFDYYRQAGFYDLDEHKEFWFIAQEKVAPYGVSVHKCTDDMLNYGKDESMKLLGQIKSCQDENYWPGYEIKTPIDSKDDFFEFDIPGWVRSTMA